MNSTEAPSRFPQSALHPAAGSGAELIDRLGTVLYISAGVILLLVMALVVYGVYARATPVRARLWIIGGGLVFPVVTLTALLVYSLAVGNALVSIGAQKTLQLFLDCFGGRATSQPLPDDRLLRIHVIGKQWWWEVRYERGGGATQIVLANELRMPIGRPVELVLSSNDVIHSFWVPSLGGKVDMIPGRTTRLRLQTSEAGEFRGQCSEYCGGQHALMAIPVITQSEAEFNGWLARQAQPASEPDDELLKSGYDAFFRGGCDGCHAVRGTAALGTAGPDLTHVGGRKSLAAGLLKNHVGTMAGWIAGSQDIKPGNKMPSLPLYTGVELRALAIWLGSLQ